MTCSANARSFVAALKAVANLSEEDDAKKKVDVLRRIHLQAEDRGFDTDLYVACSLVSLFGKCGSMKEARMVFNKVKQRDTVLWNSLIVGYSENGEEDFALKLLTQMRPDAVSFSAALAACVSLAVREDAELVNGRFVKVKSLEKGIKVHRQAAACDLEPAVGANLVGMYAKCGALEEAQKVFDGMHQLRSVGLWTALMLGYVENGDPETALRLFERFYVEIQPSDDVGRVFVAALKACSAMVEKQVQIADLLEQGRRIHSQALESGCLRSDVYVASALATLYCKCGSVKEARKVVDSFEQPDVVLWNSLLVGYVENGEAGAALEIFARLTIPADAATYSVALNACSVLAESEEGAQMNGRVLKLSSLERGTSIHSQCRHQFGDDLVVSSSLISMYSRCGSLTDAWKMLENLPRVDVVLWTSMMLGCAENRQGKVALELADVFPGEKDCWYFVAVLKACISLVVEEGEDDNAKASALENGKKVHREVVRLNFESNTYLANSLVEMYCKCGSLLDARAVFDGMKRKNSAVWTALMLGYIQNGEAETALNMFTCMSRAELDTQVFIAALKACGALAGFETGVEIHREVLRLGLESSVVSSLVDLYGKCGRMVKAQQVYDSVPSSDPVACSALLSGYSRQGKVKEVFHLVRRMEDEGLVISSSAVVGILSVCSHTGFVDEGQKWFEQLTAMKAEGSCFNGDRLQHMYSCLVDMLSRANEVESAMKVIKGMPCAANAEMWRSVLSASCRLKNVELAKASFDSLLDIDPQDSAAYALMARLLNS